ncbi:MAG TPA: hypothetical protein VG253_03195 [Streptosporangiaceae bacterium]|nr:hypothetical protein [Streptosporangiaceae bacterium]
MPTPRSRRAASGITVWTTTRMPDRVCVDGAVEFTLPARAVADAARQLTSFRDVRAVVADTLQSGACRLHLLEQELAAGPTRHSSWLRKAIAEVGEGIRSAAEGDLRDLICGSSLPTPIFNARLSLGPCLIAVADAWWPDAGVAAEVDSREWHLSPEDWAATLQRSAAMAAHGIIVLHFTPGQIRTNPDRVVAEIASALRAGCARPALRICARPTAG